MFDNQKSFFVVVAGKRKDVKLFQKTYTQIRREKDRGAFIESGVGSPRALRRTYMDWDR